MLPQGLRGHEDQGRGEVVGETKNIFIKYLFEYVQKVVHGTPSLVNHVQTYRAGSFIHVWVVYLG